MWPSSTPCYDGCKVVVGDDELGALSGDVRSAFAHVHAHMDGLEGRGIVGAITHDCNGIVLADQGCHYLQLLPGLHPGKDLAFGGQGIQGPRPLYPMLS